MQYEIIGGGAGARAVKDGASGTTVNQSNAKIAPVEIIESEFPTRVLRFELIRDSGGAGEFRGGLGIRREYLNLDAGAVLDPLGQARDPAATAARRRARPHRRYLDQSRHRVRPSGCRPATPTIRCEAGDVFRLDTPGGGGYGDALAREPERVLVDVREGDVSVEAAERDYGVVIRQDGGRSRSTRPQPRASALRGRLPRAKRSLDPWATRGLR